LSETNELFGEAPDMSEWENMEDGVTAPEEPAAVEPDAAPEEEAAEPEADPDGTEEDTGPEPELDPAALQAELAQLQAKLAEKDLMIGRQSEEVGEIRQLREQMAVIQEQQQRPQVSDWDSLIDDDPARAAQLALQAGNGVAYEQAKRAWEEYSPGAPAIYEQGMRLQHRLDQLEGRLEQTTAPLQQQQAQTQIAGVYEAVRKQYPDFDQFESAMSQLIDTRPMLKDMFAKVVQQGSPDEQFAYLEDLHALASGRKADTLREAAKEVARDHATETLRAKQEAQVASASANMDTGPSRTAAQQMADRIGAEWDEIEKPYKDGWQIGPA